MNPGLVEALEGRVLLSSVRFAVVGDIGSNTRSEADVARRISAWSPQFVVTTGDNSYGSTAASYDANVGQYYHSYMTPYAGAYGAGSADGVNHFFPILGNHDWDIDNGRGFTDYFDLPGNGRYYTFRRGPVEFFVIDSDSREPDGNSATSAQAQWIQAQMQASAAPWQVVLLHHPPYSSSNASAGLRWPFAAWGADAVIAGHAHTYERLVPGGDNLPYFVNGLGGEGAHGFMTSAAGSQLRYNADYGAMIVNADDVSLRTLFITRGGRVIDHYNLYKTDVAPDAPGDLAAGVTSSGVELTWTDHASNERGFWILRSADGVNFMPVAAVACNTSSWTDSTVSDDSACSYRVLAYNSVGSSRCSNSAWARMPSAAQFSTRPIEPAAAAPAPTARSVPAVLKILLERPGHQDVRRAVLD